MIKQKAISARIDNETLWEIEQECMTGRTNRNRILNEGARMWLDLTLRRRLFLSQPDKDNRRKIIVGFLRHWFYDAAEFVDELYIQK